MKKIILIVVLIILVTGVALFAKLSHPIKRSSYVSKIEVISPNKGDVFIAGDTYTIKWSGATSKDSKVGTLSLVLNGIRTGSFSGTSSSVEITTLDIKDVEYGTYQWTVPTYAYMSHEKDKFTLSIRYRGPDISYIDSTPNADGSFFGFIEGTSDYFSIVENTTPCIGEDGNEYQKNYQCVDPQLCNSESHLCDLKQCKNGEWISGGQQPVIKRNFDDLWQLTYSGVTFPECSW